MKKTLETLLSASSVALLPHINPDWDAIGSCFALQNLLRAKGIKCDVLTDAPLDFRFEFAKRGATVFDGTGGWDVLCAVDCATPERLGNRRGFFLLHENTLCIDHHKANPHYAKHTLLDASACATGEIIFPLFEAAGVGLDADSANHLFCAISTDSGSFCYSSVSSRTFEIASKLVKAGARPAPLSVELYQSKPLAQVRLSGIVMSNIELFYGDRAAISTISSEDFKKANAGIPDSEDLSDIPREIAGVEASALLREVGENEIRVSFRSKKLDISLVADSLGGGGHTCAAGATIHAPLSEAKDIIIAKFGDLLNG